MSTSLFEIVIQEGKQIDGSFLLMYDLMYSFSRILFAQAFLWVAVINENVDELINRNRRSIFSNEPVK